MYSGSTLTNLSGSFLGTHQKVDRIARKALKNLLTKDETFPSKRLLLHFEGKNGPDGMKAKSAGHNEPWHFYDPYDPEEGELLQMIEEHYYNLSKELRNHNKERAAFDAAWLAHAILDGLTPAHQYPFEQKLEDLRGEAKETRDSVYKKLIISADTKPAMVSKNWQMWGAKGLFTTHALFEGGASMVIKPMSGKIAIPNRYEIKTVQHLGFLEYYKRIAREVALYNIYEMFYKRSWTPKLMKIVRQELAPRMATTVTLAWYMAAREAGIASAEV